MTYFPDKSTTVAPAGIGVFFPPTAEILSPSMTITASGTVVPATTSIAVAPLRATRLTAGACCDRVSAPNNATVRAVDAMSRVRMTIRLLR
jgi:hypothetical protein